MRDMQDDFGNLSTHQPYTNISPSAYHTDGYSKYKQVYQLVFN